MRPRGVDLEIVEEQPADYEDPYRVVAPNSVAINGLPVLIPHDSKIDIRATEKGVLATLTVLVGRLRIEQEPEQPDDSDPPIFEQLEDELGRVPAIAGLIGAARQEIGQLWRGHSGYTLRDLEKLKQQLSQSRLW